MISRILQIWRPESFQGTGKKKNYFEGWFFKLVDKSQQQIYAIIPGVFLGSKPEESHAFIQILDGATHTSSYHRYPLEQFKAARDKLNIQIDTNHFSNKELSLNITSQERNIQGAVKFDKLNPWPVRLLSPGVMGWYAFVPFMECFHGVLSLDHKLSGQLNTGGEVISFDEGRGYIEKDWGKSFPEAYIWLQCNHFNQTRISLSASIAKIPWITGAFRGFIIGLWYNNQLYPFTTYNGSSLNKVEINDTVITIEVQNNKYLLRMIAQMHNQGQLHGPYQNQMLGHVSESLDSKIEIELYERQANRQQLLFSSPGEPAGVEANGKLEELTTTPA
jgi:hypothetical protein